MLEKRKAKEGMYFVDPQVLCARNSARRRGEAGQLLNLSSCMMLIHIRQTMSTMTTSKNRKWAGVAANRLLYNSAISHSLRGMAGNEPDKEQTGTSTHYTFPMRKSGIAYKPRGSWRRNPHSKDSKNKDVPKEMKGQPAKAGQSG
jgi:hypothetical protein